MSTVQNQSGITQSYGTIWMNTGNWSGVSITLVDDTYKELTSLGTNFTLMSPSSDFAMTTDGRLKYTGATTRNFLINSAVAINNTARLSIAVYKNGSVITGSPIFTFQTQGLTNENTPISLATNDYISLWLKRITGTTVTIFSISLGAVSII